MLNILSFFVDQAVTNLVFGIKLALGVIALACAVFIVVVVLLQKGNSDGMEAMMGNSKSDDSETYYGKNAGSRREAKLKRWTCICAAALAVCCIVSIIL